MKKHNIADCCKNAVGTVFLLAGAFFVCSTLVSMRAVFADPIAPIAPAGNNNATSPRGAGNVSPRRAAANTVSRGTTARATTSRTTVASQRSVVSRPTASRTTTTNSQNGTVTRGVSARGNVVSRGNTASRNVVSRTATNAVASRANNANTRTVRARNNVNSARVSLQGSAIRGSKASSSTYTYLSNKLYTGNYSNIIDSTTGLISSEAYSNCMESYYACMDEICTARNAAQRRCACAGRVKAFAEAEAALETANEELIKVSGELALLISTKGKDVSAAFQLTDAEKVMNCVSWQEVTDQYGTSSEEAVAWCNNHGIYGSNGSTLSSCSQPSYCAETGNNFGFDIKNIDGNSSNILSQLQAWADAKENTITILTDNEDSLTSAFDNLSGVVNGLAGIGGSLADSENLKDSLAETWGYELFEYAHNNVCSRVLDSCFNGIYEACGTPPSGGRKCGNGQSQCPYNYNSAITVTNTGTYELNFVEPSTGYTASNSATCFGYTSASGDPYSNLRGPVADARRSILQKYALDANADCDAYGEQLRTTAQNIGYQKVAAQQALQQKRMEFDTEEKETVLAEAVEASTNFDECISEIYDCYETQLQSHGPGKSSVWTAARIRTYCAQIANVPHCYETMICNPSNAVFKAIIDKPDSAQCANTNDYTTNTCRNIVTLNDILNGTGKSALSAEDTSCDVVASESGGNCDSAAMRQTCLIDAIGAATGNSTDKTAIQTWLDDAYEDMQEQEN